MRVSDVTSQTKKGDIKMIPTTRTSSALLFLLAACCIARTQEVRSNHMPGVDFSKFHTYKWVAVEGAQHPNQIVDAEIKQAADQQLAKKGLTKTDTDQADLYVGYQTAVDKEKQWNGYGTGGWRFGGIQTRRAPR
jgi:hypothetical protein